MFPGLCETPAYRFIPQDPPATVEALRARYQRLACGRSADGSELWFNWVIRQPADGGLLGYTQATVTGSQALIAYHVFPRHWRRGFGRQAVALTLDLVFAVAPVTLARAVVDTRNTASRRLLACLGFVAIRVIEGADHFKGEASNEVEFALRREEWLSRR